MNEKKYSILVEDTIKTTVPISALEEIIGYVEKNPDINDALKEETGFENPAETMRKGYKSKDKNSKEFKDFLKVCDPVGVHAYKSGLEQKLFNDVNTTHHATYVRGNRIFVYSSQSRERSQAGYNSNNQDRYIAEYKDSEGKLVKGYFSSADKGFEDKYSGEAYKKIAEKIGVKASEMLYVTDDVKEATGAVKAGVGKVLLIDRDAKELGFKDGYEIIDDFHKIGKYMKDDFYEVEKRLREALKNR